ncbi:MAG TPA: hypothetical protein VGQ57_06740 [Polyangiaceae bacterium]|jgi:hypothetical protein|nr:hypothetical protein [Polyangiaceae bacterium]
MRLGSMRWVAAVLGVGGLALAQDELIVDPWHHAVSALFPPTPAPARSASLPIGVASFPIEARPSPRVVPVGPPLHQEIVDPSAAMPVGAIVPVDAAVDPWVTPPTAAAGHPLLGRHASPSDWATEIREIVDPWSKGPLAVAARDPAIVDPWAH